MGSRMAGTGTAVPKMALKDSAKMCIRDSPNAMIDALSKSANFVGYYNNDDVFETYRIKEPNLSKWIYFFLESLASSDWVYSNEEQAAFLEDEIQKFSQEH